MTIKTSQIVVAAESTGIRKLLSPLVQSTLDQVSILHRCARTPAVMAQVRDNFIFFATDHDLQVVAGL